MSAFSRATSGLTVDLIGSVATLVVGLAVIPRYLKLFGDIGYGFWMTVSGLVGLALLLDSGVSLYLVRELPASSSEPNRKRTSFVFSNAICVQGLLVVLALLLTAIIYFAYSILKPEALVGQDVSLFPLLTLTFLVQMLTIMLSPYRMALYSLQELSLVGTLNFINTLSTLVLPLVFGYWDMGLYSFPIAAFLSNTIVDLTACLIVHRRLPGICFSSMQISRDEIRRIVACGGKFSILKGAEVIRLNIPRVIVGTLLGPVSVATYSIITKAPDLASGNASKVGNVVLPLAASETKRNDLQQRRQLSLAMMAAGLRIALVFAIGILFLNQSFVKLWVGIEHQAELWITVGLAIVVFLRTLQACIGSLLFASSNFGWLPWVAVLETTAGIVLAIHLTPQIGILGMVIGLCVCYSFSTFYYINFVKLSTGLSLKRVMLPALRYATIPSCASLFAGSLLISVVGAERPWSFIIVGMAIVVGNFLAFEGWQVAKLGAKHLLRPLSYVQVLKESLIKLG